MLHRGCIFCTPTAPQMEATAVRQSHIPAAAPPLDFTVAVCAGVLRSACWLNWGEGWIGCGGAEAAAGGVVLIEIMIIAVSKLRPFL